MLNLNRTSALIFAFNCYSITHAEHDDKINYYEYNQKRLIPKEVQASISKNEVILDYSVGHLNHDLIWDVAIVSIDSEEYEKAKKSPYLPQHRTLRLFIGDGEKFNFARQHQYIFKKLPESAKINENYLALIETENLFLHPKIKKIYDTFDSDATLHTATGGFTLNQKFDDYSYNLKFIWDQNRKDWIYDGALIYVHPQPVQAHDSDQASVQDLSYILQLKPHSDIKTLQEFHLDHPEYGNTYSLDPQNYNTPDNSETPDDK